MITVTSPWGTTSNAQSHHMRKLLGLSETEKLPAEGMLARVIQGVIVWVAPLDPKTSARRVHRVRAQCPRCAREMSAGRLFQHRCNRRVES